MDMVRGSRETKSFAVELSMTVAVNVLPETVMLIFMLWAPSGKALCGIKLNPRTKANVSTALGRHVLIFIVNLHIRHHHSMGFRSRKKPPVGPSSGKVASQTAV